MMIASSDDKNPIQDKKLKPHDIENLQRQDGAIVIRGHSGQTDSWKDREGNVYQESKNEVGKEELIGYNLNEFSPVPQ